jgi:hypothetical protein
MKKKAAAKKSTKKSAKKTTVKKPKKAAKHPRVTATLSNGVITVDKSRVSINRPNKDTVNWVGQGGRLQIDFPAAKSSIAPFGWRSSNVVSAGQAIDSGKSTTTHKHKRSFGYSITMWDAANRATTLDPIVEVDGGGPPASPRKKAAKKKASKKKTAKKKAGKKKAKKAARKKATRRAPAARKRK